MNNYEFCAQWIVKNSSNNKIRVLDYGCGAGEIVKELRNRGIDAYGCDVFYEGGDYSKDIDPGLFGDIIRKIDEQDYVIPFDSDSFDFVINNQVMEHVEELDKVLTEISRVLRPGGIVLSLFPDKGAWRECHSGIPFLHWFPKKSRPRVYYASALRSIGLGHFKGNKGIRQWSQDFCDWLDKWTYYRSREEIHSIYSARFIDVQHIEDYWLKQRLETRGALVAWLPRALQRQVVTKLGSMVFTARKRQE